MSSSGSVLCGQNPAISAVMVSYFGSAGFSVSTLTQIGADSEGFSSVVLAAGEPTVTLPIRFWIASVRPGSGFLPVFFASKHLSRSQIAAFSLFFSRRTSSTFKAAGTLLSVSICPSCMILSISLSSIIAVTQFAVICKSLAILALFWPLALFATTAVLMAWGLRDLRGG